MRTLRLFLALFCALVLPPAATAQPLPREVQINGVEFVHIPAGWFWYALENGAWNKAGRAPDQPFYRDIKVWLDGYYLAKYEARARDFERFMNTSEVRHRADYAEAEKEGCSVQRRANGRYFLVSPEKDLPATHLSWQLADEFTRWMGFRLPTETEWAKAARGTDKRVWPWGDEYPDDTRAGYNADFECSPSPVDAFPLGRSPYGLYNMAGNAYEFVQDWYNEDWDKALQDGARNPGIPKDGSLTQPYPEKMKVMRGGRWSSPANGITVHRRNMHEINGIYICFGTRFAIDEAAVQAHLSKGTAKVLAP